MQTDEGAMGGHTQVFWADMSRARTEEGREVRGCGPEPGSFCPSQNADTPMSATKRGFIHKVAKGEDEKTNLRCAFPKARSSRINDKEAGWSKVWGAWG